MSLADLLKAGGRTLLGRASCPAPCQLTPESPDSRDALAAIEELSQAVRNDPDAVEIYLALGNLYRLRGDIDRAIQIRNSLIVRPGLDNRFRARAYLELGRDYRRAGFVDRALHAFGEARRLGADTSALDLETAQLHADSGNFEEAAPLFGKLGHSLGQAHYMVRHAEDLIARGDLPTARKLLARAVKIYPGSAEAWTARIIIAINAGEWRKVRTRLREALEQVAPEIRFLVLEGVMALPVPDAPDDSAQAFEERRCDAVLSALESQEPDLLLTYYGALFHLRCANREAASNWLARAMILKPDFWAARLELLAISMGAQDLSPAFRPQLEYFIEQARHVNRFVCTACGLRREQPFHICPRCRSWHSARFRLSLQD